MSDAWRKIPAYPTTIDRKQDRWATERLDNRLSTREPTTWKERKTCHEFHVAGS